MNVYKNDVTEWVIAESPEDATEVLKETMGWSDEDIRVNYPEGVGWEICPLDKSFTFHGGAGPETKTFREWVAEKGRCYFATSEY